MQIKKMKDTGQQLFTPQVNGHNSLTMSPRQPNADNRAPRPDRQDAQTLLCQGSEAEPSVLTTTACVKCKSVHKVPLQDLRKGTGQGPKEDGYECFQCSRGVAAPRFHLGDSNPSATHVGNKMETISSPGNHKFKVRNFKPGKYYCDKCRFSTKDPLQYRKHTLQHEEIKFICSHCSYISYTKGEFQRHLVKHTGIFPYQCEYCDYGAIRNDYIVKHRRRVHERAGGKRPPKTVAKLEPKRTSTSKATELLKASDSSPAFQSKLSDQLSRFSLHTSKDKTHNVRSIPESKEHQKDVVCVPNKMPLLEPNEVTVFEDKSVEVEVLSPAREPVQPGMPLTVVAPAELVVPANCLAQLIDVKVVNGTQQLVLKLFPLEENNSLEAGGGDGGHSERMAKEKRLNEQEKIVSAEQTKSLTIGRNVAQFGGVDNLQSSVQKQLKNVKWMRSYDFFMSNSSVHSYRESFLNSERVEYLQKKSHMYPHRTTLPPVALKRPSPSSVDKNSVLWGLGSTSNPFPYKAAVSFTEDGRNVHSDPQRLLPLAASPATISFLGEKGLLPIRKSNLESRSEISIPLTMVPSTRKGKDSQTEEYKAVSTIGQRRSEYLHINITGEDRIRSQQPGDKPLELKNSERTSDSFEGPVISSVFSLSSGSEDVPEGVKWNSSTSKIKSIELLRRKIAQLIESCGRPSSLAANNTHRRSVGQAAKVPEKATPEGVREINVSFTGTGYPPGTVPKPRDAGGICAQLTHSKHMYPQFAGGRSGKTESRGTRKAHVATPVLIPKGAVLRVLNSSKDAHVIEATCGAPVNIPCSETQLIKPIPFCPAKQINSDLQSLTSENGAVDMSHTLDTTLRPKPRKGSVVCSTTAKKAGPLHGLQGSSELSKQGKLLPRSLSISKNKSKQVHPSKKKSKIQADASHFLKDPSIFQVARQLRLIAAKPDQLIKCPRRNQPVIVLNHPDVDSPEVTNVMKVINKYKGNVLKVVLSERTRCQLGIRRHHIRLTYRNLEEANQIKRQMMLKMKLKKVHKNNYQVVGALPDDAQCIFKCWFCGRLYEDQEEWMSHGQRHLIEATRDWDVLSSRGK